MPGAVRGSVNSTKFSPLWILHESRTRQYTDGCIINSKLVMRMIKTTQGKGLERQGGTNTSDSPEKNVCQRR